MKQNSFEEFRRRVFDELDILERADRQRIVQDFVEAGKRVGIDVVTELLDRGKSASEVFDAIREKQTQQGPAQDSHP